MSTSEPPIPSKPNFMETMLSEIATVNVHFRTSDRGVVVPGFVMKGPIQMFQYGLNQPRPIPDLELARDGIVATLSFNNEPFYTFVPWGAIFAIHADGDMDSGFVWNQDRPMGIAPPPSGLQAALDASAKIKAANHLRLVPLDGPQEELTEPRLTIHDLRVIQGGLRDQEEI